MWAKAHCLLLPAPGCDSTGVKTFEITVLKNEYGFFDSVFLLFEVVLEYRHHILEQQEQSDDVEDTHQSHEDIHEVPDHVDRDDTSDECNDDDTDTEDLDVALVILDEPEVGL